VPLEFEGTPPAVRELDGVLITNLTELEVECLPADLPPQLTVDIGSLATFEDAITVADLPVPAAVTVLTEPETNVAAVTPPRTEEEMAELDEPVEEAPEPEDAVEGEEGEEGAEGKGEEGGAEGGEASEGSTDDASGGKPEGKSEKG
jgi:large subunit ribosomal protein L25